MPYKHLVVRRVGPVEHVELNRPEVRNAFNEEVIADLAQWARTVHAGDRPRAAVLSGNGKVFCAGADVAWMSRQVSYSRDENLRDAAEAARMFLALDSLPIPLIGRLHGAALGGGAGLASVCDIVVADEQTVFGFTEVKLGILPAIIAPYAIAKIGQAAARELFLTGRTFSAARAREIGLIQAAVKPDAVTSTVESYLGEILAAGPEAVTAAKALIRRIAGLSPADALTITTEAIAERRVSAEGQEGLRAFLEKTEAVVDVGRRGPRLVIRRVLVANRGEIALRVIRACHEMGLEAAAVYSEADRGAPHVAAANLATAIGAAPAAESYLNISSILSAARSLKCDAVHPGYGFLAENAVFADACEQAGLTFIGPPATVMAQMGSKIEARRLMEAAGLAVVPGATPTDQSDDGVAAAARRIGLPLLVKASAGGGGKGMRTVRAEDEIPEAIRSARREALAAFDDGTLYVERLIVRPRHVEVQIFGDGLGHVVHLFERECSMQRRHQKVIEETPASGLDDSLRGRMCEAAVRAAKAVDYRGAGTVEFLLEGDGPNAEFYFLEMNTRLQVEHPITEMTVGVDLVQAQIIVAAEGRLPWRQETLNRRGHAIECRIYAEDPFDRFLPQAGRILLYRPPLGPGIRFDAGIAEGAEVPVHYDPLLGKLIAHAESRDRAIARAIEGLRALVILGIKTNAPFLLSVLGDPRFADGPVDTGLLDQLAAEMPSPPAPALAAVAAGAWARPKQPMEPAGTAARAAWDPWVSLNNWR